MCNIPNRKNSAAKETVTKSCHVFDRIGEGLSAQPFWPPMIIYWHRSDSTHKVAHYFDANYVVRCKTFCFWTSKQTRKEEKTLVTIHITRILGNQRERRTAPAKNECFWSFSNFWKFLKLNFWKKLRIWPRQGPNLLCFFSATNKIHLVTKEPFERNTYINNSLLYRLFLTLAPAALLSVIDQIWSENPVGWSI